MGGMRLLILLIRLRGRGIGIALGLGALEKFVRMLFVAGMKPVLDAVMLVG